MKEKTNKTKSHLPSRACRPTNERISSQRILCTLIHRHDTLSSTIFQLHSPTTMSLLPIHIYNPIYTQSQHLQYSLFINPIHTPKMGICTSIDAASVSTAKLILPDGSLQQYSHPVKARYVLQSFKNDAFCICNSDEMDFNDVVSGLGDNEELQLGELYFALPLSVLKRPLQAAEMAELAVRASAALMKCCGGSGAWLTDDQNVNVGRVETSRRRRAAENGGRGRRRTFSTDLSAIAE